MPRKRGKTAGIIAAGHSETARAGLRMLQEGGNAFDAALAAMLASCVAEPSTTSAGGGGFLLAHTPRQNLLFDFFSQTPLSNQCGGGKPHFKGVDINFGSAVQTFHIGMASATVPGFVAGVFHVHQRLGSLPMHLVAEPAIELCRKGVRVTPFQANAFRTLSPILSVTPSFRDVFYKQNGGLVQPGDTFFMPQFADFLEELVRGGTKWFYGGEPAQSIANDCRRLGGYLRLPDFESYKVLERKPLRFSYRKKVLLTNPPPSSGGLLIAFALKLLEQVPQDRLPAFASRGHVDLLVNALQNTHRARAQLLDGQTHLPAIERQMLSEEALQQFQLSSKHIKRGCTTHISVMDGQGNAAGVTSSHGEGCGYAIPGTQVMLNNMLGEEDLNPGGFHQWRANTRLSSMMAPTIVLDEGGAAQIVTGTGGANRIRTAIFQVLHNIVDRKMDVGEAVEAPRLHMEGGKLYLEHNFSPDVYGLPDWGEQVAWDDYNMFFGGVHTVAKTGAGGFSAAGDLRRAGAFFKI